MTVLMGTLGFSPEKFLGALPAVGGSLERVIIYLGHQEGREERRRSSRALTEVTRSLQSMGVPNEYREFSSPWDFDDILSTLMSDIRGIGPEKVLFNLTGGPKTMTVAATMVSLLMGVRVIYVPEELEGRGEAVELPLFRIPYSRVLTERQMQILRTIQEMRPESLVDLSDTLGLKNATVTFHMHRLEEIGAVRLRQGHSRSVRVPEVSPAGKVMLMADEALQVNGRTGAP
ncbi:MAG: MarR family transcriptional regulator [Methanomassiliicoccales archaeon]